MNFGKKISKNGKIGLVAPSSGITSNHMIKMIQVAVKKFNLQEIKVNYNKNIYKNKSGSSSTAKSRSEDLLKKWNDKTIDCIISVGGGDYCMEILEHLNKEDFKTESIKYFQGCSDNSILCFWLTTVCDIATIYGKNFYEFGIKEWHKVQKDNFEFLLGKSNVVSSNDFVEESDYFWKCDKPLIKYNCNKKNVWKIFPKQNKFLTTGRVIGGLLDNLSIVCGTKYDNMKLFLEKYKSDGFIWYIESCEYSTEQQVRAIWQLKNAGWFKNAKTILIGRPSNNNDSYKQSNIKLIYNILKELNIPIIFDCDIGHVQPTFYMVNGSIANLNYCNGKATINFIERM